MKYFKLIILTCSLIIVATSSALAQSTIEATPSETTKVSSIKVKGITCGKDLKMISDNVEDLQGVNSCAAAKKGPTTTFEVTYDPALVTEKEIHKAIEGTGGCKDPNARPYKVKQKDPS